MFLLLAAMDSEPRLTEKEIDLCSRLEHGMLTDMGRVIVLKLKDLDVAQVVSGLEVRAKQWEDTASYLRTGELPSEFFIAEECRDTEEAESIARDYRSILRKIERQVNRQRGKARQGNGEIPRQARG